MLQTLVLQDIPLKTHVKSYCTLDWIYVAQNAKYGFLRACYVLLFVWTARLDKVPWRFSTRPDCVCSRRRGVWSREQSCCRAPVHRYRPWITAEAAASLPFRTCSGIRHQFKFPASFLTSLFSYPVSLKLLKNTWLAAISETSVETCYFRRTSLITGIYSF